MDELASSSPVSPHLRSRRLVGIIGLFIVVVMGGLALHEQWGATLEYDRRGILSGEWYRLWTAHWVHLSPYHALANGVGGALLWWLFQRDLNPFRLILILLLGSTGVSVGLLLFNPEIEWYVGASGVLHTAWAACAVWLMVEDRWLGGFVLAALIVKLAVEYWLGTSLADGVLNGMTVVTAAHRYGALTGLVVAQIGKRVERSDANSADS